MILASLSNFQTIWTKYILNYEALGFLNPDYVRSILQEIERAFFREWSSGVYKLSIIAL